MNRRTFLLKTGTTLATASAIDYAFIRGAVAQTLALSDSASVSDQRVLFISFDGGCPMQVGCFDPKRSRQRFINGTPVRISSDPTRYPAVDFDRIEASKWAVDNELRYAHTSGNGFTLNTAEISEPHADLANDPRKINESALQARGIRPERGYDLYTPPTYRNGSIVTGPVATPLLKHAPYMTVLNGVDTTLQHPTAAALMWTGDASLAVKKPTIDCLLAASLGRGMILSSVASYPWSRRNTFLNHDLPVKGAPFRIARETMVGASDTGFGSLYRQMFEREFMSRLSPRSANPTSDAFRTRLQSFIGSRISGLAANTTDSATRDFYQSMGQLFESRGQIAQGGFLSRLETDINSFVAQGMAELSAMGFYKFSYGFGDGMSWDRMLAQAGMTASLLSQGVCSTATLGMGGWDFHGLNYVDGSSGLWGRQHLVFWLIDYTIRRINAWRGDSAHMLKTSVVLMPELGRHYWLDSGAGAGASSGGQQHQTNNSMVVIGGPVGKGQIYGGTSDFYETLKVDLQTGAAVDVTSTSSNHEILTPRHLLVALAKHVGGLDETALRAAFGVDQSAAFLNPLPGRSAA
jgi:hypothetical protein